MDTAPREVSLTPRRACSISPRYRANASLKAKKNYVCNLNKKYGIHTLQWWQWKSDVAKKRSNLEASHGRGCRFWLKCFWAFALLTWELPANTIFLQVYFKVMVLGLEFIAMFVGLRERDSSKSRFGRDIELMWGATKYCCTPTVWWLFQRYPPNDFGTACHEHKSSKNIF